MSASAMQGGRKKTKARFSHLLQHPAWKWRGPILFQRLIYLSLTYLLRHLPTYYGTHTAPLSPYHTVTLVQLFCN